MTDEIYYKATQPDGKSFRTPRVDYGAALISGEVIEHPAKEMVRNDPSTYLSVSVVATDCTGFTWPCRLFRVEPVGAVMGSDAYLNKRAVSALRVVEELPAWQALGPNGESVAAVIEKIRTATPDQITALATARDAARDAARGAAWGAARVAARGAAWGAAWDAAWDAAWVAARVAARGAAWDAARDAARGAARVAAWGAVEALLVRDLITPEQYEQLVGPWVSVMGPIA